MLHHPYIVYTRQKRSKCTSIYIVYSYAKLIGSNVNILSPQPKPKPQQDDAATRKKTDEPSPDDPQPKEGEGGGEGEGEGEEEPPLEERSFIAEAEVSSHHC